MRAVANLLCAVTVLTAGAAAHAADRQAPATDGEAWAPAARNAEQANEALRRCRKLMYAWYKHRGKDNQLLPRNLRQRHWNAKDAAADNWSFYVITSYLTDRAAHNTFVRRTLLDEVRLTTRVEAMGDDYDLDRNRFTKPRPDLSSILFGASEYVKDGLLPIIELTGRNVWFERGRQLLIDVMTHSPVETRYGKIPSGSAEVCGEMLQCLSRYYCATGDPRFKQWAFRIADAWLLDVLPNNNDLPCHDWDFPAGKPKTTKLSLSDHGNEIVFGLSEALMLAHVHDAAKAKQYLPATRKMIDKLLRIAVNRHGLWVHSIDSTTGKVTKANTPDTWGYALNAVYVMHLVTGEGKYRDAVVRAMRGINADERYLNWGGADAFADSIEGGIILYNRIREPQTLAWLEKITPTFLARQRADGIVEGWHGDGNYARTALMWALMKTAGTYVTDWREDVKFGAAVDGDALHVQVAAGKPWKGKLHFDFPRHRMHVGLTVDYPRLNHFPEWYTVEPARLYAVSVDGEASALPMLGDTLIRGLPVEVGDKPVRITVRSLPGPPYGKAAGGSKVTVKDGAASIVFRDEQHAGRGYRWCGREPIEFRMPAKPGRGHTLALLWGAKDDRRGAIVTVNGRRRKLLAGGYDGFEWLTLQIDVADVPGDAVTVRIEPDPAQPKAAFIAEARLTSP